MNQRERALAAMRGQPVDHIPFIARMDLWYSFHKNQDSLPHPYEKASLWDIQRDLGIGIFGFGAWDISFYRLVHQNVEVVKSVQGQETITEYRTPYGSLKAQDIMAELGLENGWTQDSHGLEKLAGIHIKPKYPEK